MAGFAHFSWVTPACMVGALLLGILFALGHDLFYQSLAGSQATDRVVKIASSEVSKQQLNIAIGTSLAFLVKASLVSAVSLAYLQVVWRVVRSERRVISLENMDVFMSALGNAISLANFSTWWKWPLLLLIALISWLIPLASIVTPATLTVGTSHPPSEMRHVPDIAFTGLSFMAPMYIDRNSGIQQACNSSKFDSIDCATTAAYFYNGPSDAVKRVVAESMAQGKILTVDAPASNSSWSLKFPGPTMQCSEVTGKMKRDFELSIANYTIANCKSAPGFVAWTPPDTEWDNPRVYLPYLNWGHNKYTLNTGGPLERSRGMDAPMFISIIPSLLQVDGNEEAMGTKACEIIEEKHSYKERVTELLGDSSIILRCDVYNSTYHTDFLFTNGNQNVDIKVTSVGNTTLTSLSSISALYEEGKLGQDCDAFNTNALVAYYDNLYPNCTFYPHLLRQLSYQATMDAFEQLITGNIAMAEDNARASQMFSSNTSIAETVLALTPELNFLVDTRAYIDHNVTSLQALQPSWGSKSIYTGLWNEQPSIKTPFKETLEEMFRNATVSLMSSAILNSNKSSVYYPAKTNVTISDDKPVYMYARSRLWLAYGLAVAFSTLTVVIGLVMVFLNGASFTDSFSNLMRLSRGAELSIEIQKEDLDGKNPLPEYMKAMTIKFRRDSVEGCDYKPLDDEASVEAGTEQRILSSEEGRHSDVRSRRVSA